MIIWLTLDDLLEMATEDNLVVDRSVLSQVVDKCNNLANLADSSIAEIAAAYAYYLIVAEPPFEGNVIMADSASTNFLMLNEYLLICQPPELVDVFRQVVTRSMGLRGLTRWYSSHIKHFTTESRLTETEEVNEPHWREICRWIDTEWEGGGWVNKDEELTIFAARGAMSLKFKTYKHGPDKPRVLYMIQFPGARGKEDLNLIFDEGTEIPATLDAYLALYAVKRKEDYAYPSPAAALRALRKRIKTVQADEGYKSLAEVYEYVMHQLRAPVSHGELHTDTSEYEESVEAENLFADEQLTGDQLSALRALHAQWQREYRNRPRLTEREWRKLIAEYNDNYRDALTKILRDYRAEVLSEEPEDPLKAERPATMIWLFAWLRAKEILTHVEHEQLHTDVGGYEEGIDFRLLIKTDLSLLGE